LENEKSTTSKSSITFQPSALDIIDVIRGSPELVAAGITSRPSVIVSIAMQILENWERLPDSVKQKVRQSRIDDRNSRQQASVSHTTNINAELRKILGSKMAFDFGMGSITSLLLFGMQSVLIEVLGEDAAQFNAIFYVSLDDIKRQWKKYNAQS